MYKVFMSCDINPNSGAILAGNYSLAVNESGLLLMAFSFRAGRGGGKVKMCSKLPVIYESPRSVGL
jgi:hypothetical protein